MNGSTDGLARRIALGEEPAFSEFAHRYSGKFYAYLRRCGLHDAAAQDVACDCITDIPLKVKDRYTPGTNFEGWVFTLVRNAAYTWFRKEKRFDFKELPLFIGEPAREYLPPSALARLLGELVEQLEPIDRDIIRLRYGGLETPPFPAIAEELSRQYGKMTDENARQRHGRALRKLKRQLNEIPREESNV